MEFKDQRRMLEKMRRFDRAISKNGGVGTTPRGLLINYSNQCNFKCQQCFTQSPSRPVSGTLDLDDMKQLADQADALGMYEILIEGGEPLVCKQLYDIIKIFGADRFYIEITTNGFLLTEQVAERLKEAGMARVSVSLDSISAQEHDFYRGVPGAYAHAVDALANAKKAGMQASVNFLVGHYNVHSGEIEQMCDFCQKNGYHLSFVPATPTGNWQGKFEVMLTREDADYLETFREKYRHVWRDIWPPLPNKNVKNSGCIAVNRPYINPYGDVLPCSYLHMKLGNIKNESLEKILARGFTYECFCSIHERCFAGEEPEFMKKYCMHKMSILEPVEIEKVFSEEDKKRRK